MLFIVDFSVVGFDSLPFCVFVLLLKFCFVYFCDASYDSFISNGGLSSLFSEAQFDSDVLIIFFLF